MPSPVPTSRLTRANVLVGGVTIDGPSGSPAGVRQFVPKVIKVPVTAKTTGEKDTTIDLPTKGIVLDVWVDVTTLEATSGTKTIDVGLLSSESGGDTDGFLVGVSTAAAATKARALVSGGVTAGALFKETITDSGSATASVFKPHVLNGTAKSLVYQLGAAHTELVADIYVLYIDLT